MKKTIDQLTQALEKSNIPLPESARRKDGGSNSDDKERVHALMASTSQSSSFIIDSGASRHMVSASKYFTSLDSSSGLNIVLGDNSETSSKGKGSIDLEFGSFNNVLYVPGLAANLLSVYQMTHTGLPKRVNFTPNDVEIAEISTRKIIAFGTADHCSRIYKFSHFVPNSSPSALLTHANESSKLWHEIFGHLNYKYLSQLHEKEMVIGLPNIKFSKGVCQSCILGKHPEHKYGRSTTERTTAPLELIHTDI
jgi:hypothetical protein